MIISRFSRNKILHLHIASSLSDVQRGCYIVRWSRGKYDSWSMNNSCCTLNFPCSCSGAGLHDWKVDSILIGRCLKLERPFLDWCTTHTCSRWAVATRYGTLPALSLWFVFRISINIHWSITGASHSKWIALIQRSSNCSGNRSRRHWEKVR